MTTMQLTNKPCGAELQNMITASATELASVQSGCDVNTLFRPSVVDLETGKHGIRWQIVKVLEANNATTPAAGMTLKEIEALCRPATGKDKYPRKTFSQNLSVVLKDEVASVTGPVRGRGQPPKLYFLRG